jgi:serine/threonine-protein kinase RsbW
MHSITLVIESLWEDVDLAAAAVRGLCAPIPLSTEQIDAIELSVVETLNNTVKHAYEEQPGHTIKLIWSISTDYLQIEILSWGKPMERIPPGELPDADSENGRGWYIIKSCIDQIECYSHKDGTNVVKLVKQLDT